MKHIATKSLLALALLSTIGLSADFTPDEAKGLFADYEWHDDRPVVTDHKQSTQPSRLNKAILVAGSLLANAFAVSAIVFADSCIDPTQSHFMRGKSKIAHIITKGALVGLSATGIFATMKDLGFKTREDECLLIALLISLK